MKYFASICREDIVQMYQFGSSVEGKLDPGDIDIFVIVKDGKYNFKKSDGMYVPFIFEEDRNQYFVMPEDGGINLLNKMLYWGRKNPDRRYSGHVVPLL